MREKVRTSSRALTRLADLAVEAAGQGAVDVAVHHLGAPERAEQLAGTLKDRLASGQGTDLTANALDVQGVKIVAAKVDGADSDALRAAGFRDAEIHRAAALAPDTVGRGSGLAHTLEAWAA